MTQQKEIPYTGTPIQEGDEHFPGCPCYPCTLIRQITRQTRWESLSVVDRVTESLGRIEEGDPRPGLPERAMFCVADIVALVELVRAHDRADKA